MEPISRSEVKRQLHQAGLGELSNEYGRMLARIAELEAEVAKLQAGRDKLKKLIEKAFREACSLCKPLLESEVDELWFHKSETKRRLDEITGGDAEGGN